MNDTMRIINHKIQEMSFEDLKLICTKHDIYISDKNISIFLSLIKDNPSTVILADHYPIIYIEIINKIDAAALSIIKPLIENGYLVHDVQDMCKIN